MQIYHIIFGRILRQTQTTEIYVLQLLKATGHLFLSFVTSQAMVIRQSGVGHAGARFCQWPQKQSVLLFFFFEVDDAQVGNLKL